MQRKRACLLGVLLCVAVDAQSVAAQRFEGIITMKMSGGFGGEMAGRAGGRSAVPGNSVRGGAARGAAGRGDGARGDAARGGGDGRGVGRGGDAGGADHRAEAMRTALAGAREQIEYMTRRGKVRVALGGGAGASAPAAMIYSPDDGVIYTVFPAMSMYAEMSMSDMAAMGNSRADTAAPPTGRAAPRPPVITHTKQFELIAGHRCEHVLIVTGQAKTDVCMGKGLGVFIMPAVGRTDAWNQVMTEANGFPLKVVGPNGQVIMEVTKIERKALGEALFNVPDNYTKMPDISRRPPG